MERVIAAEVAASAMEFFCEVRSCTRFAGGVGVKTKSSVGRSDLRKRGIAKVDEGIELTIV